MKAYVQHRYGGTETLELADRPVPEPGPGEVLVRVRAAAVDRGTWHLLRGNPYAVRLVTGLRRPNRRNRTPGRDVAGVVTAVGPDVDGFGVGDHVLGTARGSLAELAVVPTSRLARVPTGHAFEAAAALPVSGVTALQAVRDAGRVSAGQRVLVIGASGGVGTYVVQIAAAYGAHVTGVASTTKLDLVRSLGAEHVVDYTRTDLAELTDRYDVVIDIGGNRPLATLRRLLTADGTLVLAGGEDGGPVLGGVLRNLVAAIASRSGRQRVVMHTAHERADDMAVLAGMVEDGAVRPVVDRVFPFAEAEKALLHLDAGHARGKVVVAV